MLARLLRLVIAPKTLQPRWIEDRLMWVASIDRTLEAACNEGSHRSLIRAEVVWSCVPALHTIKEVLADPARHVAPNAIKKLRDLPHRRLLVAALPRRPRRGARRGGGARGGLRRGRRHLPGRVAPERPGAAPGYATAVPSDALTRL